MQRTSRNEKCPCGSGKKYKKCCGPAGGSETFYTKPMSFPGSEGVEPIFFFLVVMKEENFEDCPPVVDDEGRVMVFRSRPESMQFAHREFIQKLDMTVSSMGMGPAKWRLFSTEISHVIVDANGEPIDLQ